MKYKLENLKQDISSQNETIKQLEEQLDQLDVKYTEALDRIQILELSSTNLTKENQYLKEINSEVKQFNTILIGLIFIICFFKKNCVYS